MSDLVDQCPCSRRRRRHLSKRIRCAGDSVRTFVSRLGKNEVCRSGAEEGKEEEEEGALRARARLRSMSCPSLPCREEKRNVRADVGQVVAVGSSQPPEEVTNMIGPIIAREE